MILQDRDAVPMLAVTDLERAKNFYESVLGIRVRDSAEEQVLHCQCGISQFMLYRSEFAGTNKANSLCWGLGDLLETTVKELKTKGVNFEHYDFPNTHLEGDIHVSGEMKMAWFKDPDGNILHLMNK